MQTLSQLSFSSFTYQKVIFAETLPSTFMYKTGSNRSVVHSFDFTFVGNIYRRVTTFSIDSLVSQKVWSWRGLDLGLHFLLALRDSSNSTGPRKKLSSPTFVMYIAYPLNQLVTGPVSQKIFTAIEENIQAKGLQSDYVRPIPWSHSQLLSFGVVR